MDCLGGGNEEFLMGGVKGEYLGKDYFVYYNA